MVGLSAVAVGGDLFQHGKRLKGGTAGVNLPAASGFGAARGRPPRPRRLANPGVADHSPRR
jgi:hypothetical protein